MNFTYNDALALATSGHADQVDRSGVPYIEHVVRVADIVAATGADEHTRIAAVLHDYVEDVTLGDFEPLRAAGVPEESLVMIDGVTRRADPNTPSGKEHYQRGLIARATRHDGSRLIKLIDNGHNTLPRRVALLGPQQDDMSRKRYTPARATLLAAERARRAEGLNRDFPTDPDEFLVWVRDLDDRLERARA
jgi:(p)ppGpp synthase/HD superfamily hydrolase